MPPTHSKQMIISRRFRIILKAACRLASTVLRLILIAWCISPSTAGLWAQNFQFPLERSSHSFSLQMRDSSGAFNQSYPLQNTWITDTTWDDSGNVQTTSTSHLEASSPGELTSDYFIVDQTTGESTPINLFGTPSFERYSFLSTPWFTQSTPWNGATEPGANFFLTLPATHAGHHLTLFGDQVEYEINQSAIPSYIYDNYGFPTVACYDFFDGWTSTSPSGDYLLFDHDTGEQTSTHSNNNRDFTSDNWVQMGQASPTKEVYVWLNNDEAGYEFLAQSSAGTATWTYPSWIGVSEPDGTSRSGLGFSFMLGVNQTFWIQRNDDGTTSPTQHLGVNDLEVDFTTLFTPIAYQDPPAESPPPPTTYTTFSVQLEIGANRANHDLQIVTQDGSTFSIDKGQIQGFWSGSPQSVSWFTSYYFFTATGTAYTEINWWVHDNTTGEDAPLNTNYLVNWPSAHDSDDSDFDGLPDWYEFLIGTRSDNSDTDGDGIPDGWEIAHGLNPTDASDANAIGQFAPLTNLQQYQLEQGLGTVVPQQLLSLRIEAGRAGHSFYFLPYGGSPVSVGAVLEEETDADYTLLSGIDFSSAQAGGTSALQDVTTGEVINLPTPPPGPSDTQFEWDATSAIWSQDNPSQEYFLVPTSQANDVFLVYTANGNFYPVTTRTFTGTIAQSIYGDTGPTSRTELSGLHDAGVSFQLIDFSTNQMGVANGTDLYANRWSPNGVTIPLRTLTVILPQNDSGTAFDVTVGGQVLSAPPG